MKILTYRLGMVSTNCYLVYDETSNKACLIDPAEYDAKITDVIEAKKLALEYIILTHGHFDHILGANMFREKTGAKILRAWRIAAAAEMAGEPAANSMSVHSAETDSIRHRKP